MTRFIYDQFTQQYIQELLKELGEIETSKTMASERQEIDIFFTPNPEKIANASHLGLLRRLATTPAVFEPFSNAVKPREICSCLVKLLVLKAKFEREAMREKKTTDAGTITPVMDHDSHSIPRRLSRVLCYPRLRKLDEWRVLTPQGITKRDHRHPPTAGNTRHPVVEVIREGQRPKTSPARTLSTPPRSPPGLFHSTGQIEFWVFPRLDPAGDTGIISYFLVYS